MLIAPLVAALAIAGQPNASGIEMRAIRFWLPADKKTSVMTMVEVPYALATPVGSGMTSYLSYGVTVSVQDEKGKELYHEQWARHAAAALRAEKASGMEELSFAVAPGVYSVVVSVRDSASGRLAADTLKVEGYAKAPEVSDLMVANRIRYVTDTNTDVGEVARGPWRLVTSPLVHVDLTQPTLGFLMEVYTPDSTTASYTISVTSMSGVDLVPLGSASNAIGAGGGVVAKQVSMEGMPPGSYMLRAVVTVHGQKFERSAPFSVNEPSAALARQVTMTNANRGLDEVYFNSLPEDSLDAAAEELVLFPNVDRQQLAAYKKDELSLAAKRRFLIEFWSHHDVNKATPENETRLAFYQGVGYANTHFGERFRPGWKTDRGRIVAKYGLPDDSLTNPMEGRGIRYLVWRMSHGKDRWFIFGDRSNTGQFVLMRSNETTEPGVPGWVELVTPEQARVIAQWLGLPATFFTNG